MVHVGTAASRACPVLPKPRAKPPRALAKRSVAEATTGRPGLLGLRQGPIRVGLQAPEVPPFPPRNHSPRPPVPSLRPNAPSPQLPPPRAPPHGLFSILRRSRNLRSRRSPASHPPPPDAERRIHHAGDFSPTELRSRRRFHHHARRHHPSRLDHPSHHRLRRRSNSPPRPGRQSLRHDRIRAPPPRKRIHRPSPRRPRTRRQRGPARYLRPR